jgi:hypothetical protein
LSGLARRYPWGYSGHDTEEAACSSRNRRSTS